MKVTTAVIFAAGFGSRMLPVTAAVQKELLPILDRPIIDYVVSDCLAAGITHIIFVTHAGSRGLQDYYLGNAMLETHLTKFHKDAALAKLKQIHGQAKFSFVEDDATSGYGTAVSLILAAPHLPKDEAVLVCGGDNFLWRTDGKSDLANLVEAFNRSSAEGAIVTVQRPIEDLGKYGVLAVSERGGEEYLSGIVEKPRPGEAPSNLINISQYIVSPVLMNYVLNVQPDKTSGELYITDAIQAAAQDHPVVVSRATGTYLDAGSTHDWLAANLVVAGADAELRKLIEPNASISASDR